MSAPSASCEYAVAIGAGAEANEYAEIVFATKAGAELRMLMDGAIYISKVFIGKDLDVYEAFRNLFGLPLPGKPRSDKGSKAFPCLAPERLDFKARHIDTNPIDCFDSIIIGDYRPTPIESGMILFQNRMGEFFKIIPGSGITSSSIEVEDFVLDLSSKMDRKLIVKALRSLLRLPLLLVYHDDHCGDLLTSRGNCLKCGFAPDMQSVGFKWVDAEVVDSEIAAGKSFLGEYRTPIGPVSK